MTDTLRGEAGREPAALRLYRPSNGCEGDGFHAAFCDRCEHDREWREHERNPCEIHNAALCFGTREEGFPTEWRYDDSGAPTCTAFVLDPTVPARRPMTAEDVAAMEVEAERVVFEMLAHAHPVEAHAEWPDRFWDFFQRERPGIDRATMERLLTDAQASEVQP